MNSSSPSYVIGIDLGTSHTVVAYAALTAAGDEIALLSIPQRSSAGEVQAQTLLPSVRYQAAAGELGDAWQQPWPPQGASDEAPAVVGRWARDLGTAVPSRLVASAKSWLSHPGVDRSAAILPWGAGDEVAKISPLAASASYLAHVKAAWEQAHPQAPLSAQIVVLTVPASFDEGARALTVEAAQRAGLPQVHLLEEPKAAFHDWLVLQGEQLAARLADSRLVLVVDVGGGTTDLTLIRVDASADGGLPTLTRTAVGEHLMLGGDNMDLALAHHLEPQFAPEGKRLPAARFAQLVQRCRIAKEQLLAADAPEQVAVTLLGGGSRLLAQSKTASLSRAQVQQWVVEGFLPLAERSAVPSKRQGALRGFGLPYPADAAITRHLAQFLAQHAGHGGAQALPDTVLLNGGVFHAHAVVERLTQQLSAWRGAPVRVLHNRCPHKGTMVAGDACGNTGKFFRCPYHAWTFKTDGSLLSIPLKKGYENTGLENCEASQGMAAVKDVKNHRDFVFCRLAPEGIGFEEFFGPSLSTLDNMVDRSPEGRLEVAGGVLRYMHRCNWKMLVDNQTDTCHPMVAHESSAGTAVKVWEQAPAGTPKPMAVELFAPFISPYEFFENMGIRVWENGHGHTGVSDSIHAAYSGIPGYWESMVAAYGEERAHQILGDVRHNTVYFPNIMVKGPIQTLRIFKPIAADRTLVESWTFRLVGAPDTFLERTLMYNRLINAPTSMVGHDDLEMYERAQHGLQSRGRDWMNLARLVEKDEDQQKNVVINGTSEMQMRAQFRAWLKFMLPEQQAKKEEE